MDREDFMNVVYAELASDPDNCRANRIIDAADEYAESARPDNQAHLCDSCSYTYPECPSVYTYMIYGNGTGNDNICACSKYLPLIKLNLENIGKDADAVTNASTSSASFISI